MITYASRNLFTCARCSLVVMRFIPPLNSSSSFEVSAIFGMIILMTFVATLDIYGIASRDFILVSIWVELFVHVFAPCLGVWRS